MPDSPRRSATSLIERVGGAVVGLRREAELLVVSMQTGRHVLLEGPPGSGKSTLLGRLASEVGRGMEFVEGNAELTPGRLIGQFDPAMVLNDGYRSDYFLPGPLVSALRNGSWLYVEEFNRIPEETLNVLLTVLAEGEIHVPRLGRIEAAPGFWLVSAMNPYDAVGTARISQAVADRMCRVAVDYQDETAERDIVTKVCEITGPVAEIAVAVARGTREHPQLRSGSSVRGAIDMTLLATGLADLRETDPVALDVLRDAAVSALSGRVAVDDGSEVSRDDIVLEILANVLKDREDGDTSEPQDDDQPDGGGGDAAGPDNGAGGRPQQGGGDDEPPEWTPPTTRPSARSGRTVSRRELELHHPAFESVTAGAGGVDEVAFEQLLARSPEEALPMLAEMARATDPELRRQARALAGRVFVRAGRSGPPAGRATRRLHWRAGSGEGDLDLERSIERACGRPRLREHIVTREWTGAPRHLTLLVDHSGSMSGDALANAAVAAAAVSMAARGADTCRIFSFADEAQLLFDSRRRADHGEAIQRVLALQGHGRTNLAGALRAAALGWGEAPGPALRDTVVLSDCIETAGAQPGADLTGLGRVHVLNPSDSEDARLAGRRLARLGRGRFESVVTVGSVAPALSRLLGAG